MKRYAKNVNILDLDFIEICIADCLRKKWKRKDVCVYFCSLLKISKAKFRQIAATNRKFLIEKAAILLRKELATRKLKLPLTWYRKKIDSSSHKERWIGIQNIKQQFCDYVAVYGMRDMLGRIGEFQCASIPGRGPIWGVKHIKKWLKEKDSNYFVKMDIKKCFPSISHDKLLSLVRKYLANDNLIWLVDELVKSMADGLSIGSYLSQYLCNFYMSFLYHKVKENLFFERRGKKIPMVKHLLIYMDDILLIGSNSKMLLEASKRIVEFIDKTLDLTVKHFWSVTKLDDKRFIDIMGFRIYKTHITIRRRVFLRIRRAYKRARKYRNSVRLARKCNSYKGHILHTDSLKFAKRYHVYDSARRARRLISNASKIRQRAA